MKLKKGDLVDYKIGIDLREDIINYLDILNPNKIFLLTDNNIYNIYEEYIINILNKHNYNISTIASGEEYKSIESVLDIYDELIENNYGRNDLFIGFGGGIIGDIGGFIASTYMRGIKYIQIPTTLLAQVDSSIGGKTGFDYRGIKNIIGSFYFPEKTFIDIEFIKTLDKRNIISGFGEILKYGLIDDFSFFNNIVNSDLEFNTDKLLKIVEKSIETKIKFVNEDKNDHGKRRELNFGHTIGHGIESLYNFERYNHGEAIILGMQYESYIGYLSGKIEEDYLNKILDSLSKLITPIKFDNDEIESIIEIMEKDKKNIANSISMILPIGKGKVKFFEEINTEYIKIALKGEWFED